MHDQELSPVESQRSPPSYSRRPRTSRWLFRDGRLLIDKKQAPRTNAASSNQDETRARSSIPRPITPFLAASSSSTAQDVRAIGATSSSHGKFILKVVAVKRKYDQLSVPIVSSTSSQNNNINTISSSN